MGNEINLIQVEQFIENFKSENSKEVISISTTPNKHQWERDCSK